MKIITSILFIILWVNLANAKPVAKITCKIATQVVIQLSDGKPELYGGISEGPQIDDELVIFFEYEESYSDLKVTITPAHFGINLTPSFILNRDIVNPDPEVVYFYEGFFGYDNLDFRGTVALTLERYFKSDWSGFISKNNSKQSQTLALDCRADSISIEKLVKKYKSLGF